MSALARRHAPDSLHTAITLQIQADALALKGQYWTAAVLFEKAAAHAFTERGAEYLRARAAEARAQIQQRGTSHESHG